MTPPTDRPVIGLTYSSADIKHFLLWRNMFTGFANAGAALVSLDCHLPQEDLADTVARLDGLVLSGGADVHPRIYGGLEDPLIGRTDPVRDRNETVAFDTALNSGIPVLAICRGVQFVNAHLGGTLYADLRRDIGGTVEHQVDQQALARTVHNVDVVAGSRLAAWMGTDGRVAVNSEHHQGIRELARMLRASATAPDGLVEGIELDDHPMVGVQWHPELLWPHDRNAATLLRGFVTACTTARADSSSCHTGR